jgi:uracil-DNA glycosylase
MTVARPGTPKRVKTAGELRNGVDPDLVVTIHPSAVLRGPREARHEAFEGMVSDLRFAARRLTDL